MNHTLKISFLVMLFLAWFSPENSWAEDQRPNVILFLVDDLGWSDLGCYGSSFYETPHIDHFAAQSMRFTQAYAACHVCSPTRASILTGKYPARLQLTDWLPGRKDFPFQQLLNAEIEEALPLEEVTLAETLKKHGYRTAHLGKWHLGEEPFGPTQQGFDLQIPQWNKGWPKAGYHAPFEMEGLEEKSGDYLTDRLTDVAEEFLEENQDQPFFLYFSHFAVHDPIEGREDLVRKYEQKRTLLPEEDRPFVLEGNPAANYPLSEDQRSLFLEKSAWSGFKLLPRQTVKIKQRQDNPHFAAMVESVDESLGRILKKLKELNLDQETVILFISDNGGMSAANFGNPQRIIPARSLDRAFSTSNLPLRGAKGWLYEGGIRVPLIIHWPQQKQSSGICEVPVISTDLYPTILELVGIPLLPKQHADGMSLVPLLAGEKELARDVLYWHFPHYSNHGQQSPGGAIRKGDLKLLEYFENDTVQLFHLRDDPGEQHDLAAQHPELVEQLRNQLQSWRSEISATMMSPNPGYLPKP
ncbi:Arylsulfatase A [Planctomycetales bacterium 10988]|nr:Arylsulfatase A [Planctomycetales bacterium 10988]